MHKKKVVKVSVEREKFNDKFFMVAREDGKIIEKKRWNPKTLNKEIATRIFKSNRTFDENIKRIRLSTKDYEQFEDISKKPEKPKSFRFRYFFSADIKGTRKTIGASSETKHWESVHEAKTQAFKRFRQQIAFEFSDEYDEEKAGEFFDRINNVEQGVRYEATS